MRGRRALDPRLTADQPSEQQILRLRWNLISFRLDWSLGGTTHSVQKTSDPLEDLGIGRRRRIMGGDPAWDQKTVTPDRLRRGQPLERVLSTQMIIDWPVTEEDGGKMYFTISRPVLQRLIDGRTLEIAIKPLGTISAALYALEHEDGRAATRLLFNVKD